MPYAVTVARRARQAIDNFPPTQARRVFDAIAQLADDPRPPGCVKLTNQPYWRIRVGDYRIVYDVDDASQTVTVINVGHRRDVYR